MQLCSGISGKELLPSVATIGFFDGVHRGHRFLIEQVCKAAAARGLASSVITSPQGHATRFSSRAAHYLR